MSILIAGLKFDRDPDSDDWRSADGRLIVFLEMSTPEHPWRIISDGHLSLSPYSTAYAAVKRTLQRREQYELKLKSERWSNAKLA